METHRVRLRGSVSRGGTGLIFRDATGNIPLIPSPERDVPQGDGVDIAAFVSAEVGGPVLIEAAEIDDAADKPDIRRVLKTVGEIQRLSTVELSQGYEADLQGVVTYSDSVARDTFIQDETGGIYVFPPSQGKLNLQVGQFVRLRGFIDPGAFAPAIVQPKGEVLGHRSMPTPLPLDMEDLLTGVADSRWVEVQGTVRAASAAERWPGLPMRIALLSSMRERGDDERSKASNIGAYLSKPVKNSDLRETIRKLLSAPAAPAVAGRHEPHLPAVSQQLRILLADDNVINQTVARRMLEKLGYAVTLAGDGKEALQSVHLHAQSGRAFDLVLMDVQMPEMDGLEAVRAIRKWEAGKSRMPVIALTAHAMDSHRVECLAAGMDGYIAKPLRLSQLVAEIARLCPVPDLEPMAR